MPLNYQDQIEEAKKHIDYPEMMLGKGLNQPMNNTNSGGRKILSAIQEEHGLNLIQPEMPIIQTGYENRYGDYSSSIITSDDEYTVLRKIQKFKGESVKDHHYFLLVVNNGKIHPELKGRLQVIERISYYHNTESYGYLFNNDVLDSLKEGQTIDEGEVIRRSMAYDEAGNRCDGANLNVTYLATNKTMEDAFQISKSGAYKLRTALIKQPECNINDNDIPLNLYGDDLQYKSFPDIGEDIKDGLLMAVRREKIEDSLYMQSKNRLKTIMMSDDKYILTGKVIDIDVCCNSPENLDKFHNSQLKYHYEEKMKFNREFVSAVNEIMSSGQAISMDYNVKMMKSICEKELSGAKYVNANGKIYSGTMVYFTVLHVSVPEVGDKISNRYGGKGVISEIVPDELMPIMDNGERIELIFNASTCVNRLNNAQLKEMSLTHIGSRIIEMISTGIYTYDECLDMIMKYISLCSPIQAYELQQILDMNAGNDEFKKFYIDSIMEEGFIALSMKPISESLSIDDIERIYDEFPWAKQNDLYVAVKGSNGQYRYVKSRRAITCGKMFIYRLKQYAEEKFSVTSLSSTNIRNENSRSKDNKNFRSPHQSTPIRFGDMENTDLSHFGTEMVKTIMMLYSSSPHARLLVQKLYTDDPYNVNIQLDGDSVDRSAEILDVNLKTIGLRLNFIKVPKKLETPVLLRPVRLLPPPTRPVMFLDKSEHGFNVKEYYKKMFDADKKFNKYPVHIQPVKMDNGRYREEKLKDYKLNTITELSNMGIVYKDIKKKK